MPNIEFHGYPDFSVWWDLRDSIHDCLNKIGLSEKAVTEMYKTTVHSCDGLHKPYIRIFCTEIAEIAQILAGFSEDGIHEDIEILSPPMFFSKDEMAEAWRKKFTEKTGIKV